MDVKKLGPWNWFRHEDSNLPTQPQASPAGHSQALLQLHRDLERSFFNIARSFDLAAPLVDVAKPLWPNLDILTKDNEYVITVEVPGVDEKDVKLEVTPQGTLTVSGEKHKETQKGILGTGGVQHSYSSFRRVLALPDDADRDAVSAFFRNGLLTITCPRRVEAREPARQIEIQKVA